MCCAKNCRFCFLSLRLIQFFCRSPTSLFAQRHNQVSYCVTFASDVMTDLDTCFLPREIYGAVNTSIIPAAFQLSCFMCCGRVPGLDYLPLLMNTNDYPVPNPFDVHLLSIDHG